MIKNSKVKNATKTNEPDYIEVTVIGAVRFHDPFEIKFGTSIRTILVKAELLYGADLKKVDFDKKIYKSETIFIPFKTGYEKKVKLKDLTLSDLLRAGIRKKTAGAIIKFVQSSKHEVVT